MRPGQIVSYGIAYCRSFHYPPREPYLIPAFSPPSAHLHESFTAVCNSTAPSVSPSLLGWILHFGAQTRNLGITSNFSVFISHIHLNVMSFGSVVPKPVYTQESPRGLKKINGPSPDLLRSVKVDSWAPGDSDPYPGLGS